MKHIHAVLLHCGSYFDLDSLPQKIKDLEGSLAQPDLWSDQSYARELTTAHALAQKELLFWGTLRSDIESFCALVNGATEADEPELTAMASDIGHRLDRAQLRELCGGPYDKGNVIMSVYAGAGGTDAQDWAGMLERMYLRYGERAEYETTILDEQRGAEAGIKSVMIEIRGAYAYGMLHGEAGVHRLVRQSPFNADALRQTSFAMVEVLPIMEATQSITVDTKDLRIDTYLSSGKGGQNVQKNETAVRITHIPTGIAVACQNERSQQQNKETAMKILTAKLLALEQAKTDEERKRLKGEYQEAAWGNQIRSYVLHPYKMVKDHRTHVETSDTARVLDGDIDDFVDAYIRYAKQQEKA